MTNNEINEAVARKLGYSICTKPFGECPASGPHDNMTFHVWPPKDFCHSVSAAWEILDNLVSRGFGVAVDKEDAEETTLVEQEYRGWHCNISGIKGTGFSDGYGDTAPLAICKAFLQLP